MKTEFEIVPEEEGIHVHAASRGSGFVGDREIVQPAIVWGGTGAFGWILIAHATHHRVVALQVLVIAVFCFLLTAGVRMLHRGWRNR